MRLYSVAITIWAANVIATTDVSEDPSIAKDLVEYNNECEGNYDTRDDCGKSVTLIVEDGSQEDDVSEEENDSESPTAKSQRRLDQIIQPYVMGLTTINSSEPEAEDRSPVYGHYDGVRVGRRAGKTFDELDEGTAVDDVQNFGKRIRLPPLPSLPSTRFKNHRDYDYYEGRTTVGTTSARGEEVEFHSDLKKLHAAHRDASKGGQSFTFTGPEKNASNGAQNGSLTTLMSLKELKQILNIPTGLEAQSFNATKEATSDNVRGSIKYFAPTDLGNRYQAEEAANQANGKIYKSKKVQKPEEAPTTAPFNAEESENEDVLNSTTKGKLFRPIVVPEFVQPKKYTQTTAAPVHTDAENLISTASVPTVTTLTESNVIQTADVKPKPPCHDHITSSSMILNPLQVGIALVNAADAHLINNAADDPPTEELLEQASNPEVKAQSNDNEQLVETQKSIEIYHNAPVQEIHYPVELVPNTKQNNEIYRNRETNNVLNSQRTQFLQNQAGNGQPNDPGVYKSNLDTNFKQQTQSGYRQDDQTRQNYNSYENAGNNNIITPQFTTFQQYPSVLLNLDSQNYVSSTERSPLDNYVSRDQYEESLYGQSSTLQHTLGGAPQANVNPNVIRQEVPRQNVKPYTLKLEQVKTAHYADQQQQPQQHQQQSQLSDSMKILENQASLLDPMIQLGLYNAKRQKPLLHPLDVVYQNSQPNQNNNAHANEPKYLPIGALQYTVGKAVEKAVPIEIEKLMDRRIPYSTEKVIEKHVREPYAVYVQVPVDRLVEKQVRVPQPYPVHIEKVIEKKVPYTVQRLVLQPYPVHIKVPQPYPVEKPVHVPVPIEKVIEKKLHVPHPIPIEIEKTIDRPRIYPVEVTRLAVNPPPSPLHDSSYGPSNNYQQYNRDQNAYLKSAVSYYGVSRMDTQNPYNGSYAYVYHKLRAEEDPRSPMGGKDYGSSYPGYHNPRQSGGPKKFAPRGFVYSRIPYSLFGESSAPHKRFAIFPLKDMEKPMKDSVAAAARQSTLGASTKMTNLSVVGPTQSTTSTATANRIRQTPGTFRQSKMEYGFKPPMVPSIQYDEKTASKVEN